MCERSSLRRFGAEREVGAKPPEHRGEASNVKVVPVAAVPTVARQRKRGFVCGAEEPRKSIMTSKKTGRMSRYLDACGMGYVDECVG